jgi:hypothetical protein
MGKLNELSKGKISVEHFTKSLSRRMTTELRRLLDSLGNRKR